MVIKKFILVDGSNGKMKFFLKVSVFKADCDG